MIINLEGDIVMGLCDWEGIIHQKDNFAICLYYDSDQMTIYKEMKRIKAELAASDYKAAKYAEGLYTEEEYAPIKAQRQALRDEWNELNNQFVPPSITEEQAQEAINKFRAKHPVI